MTEDDARTKWCPHARVLTADASGSYPAANRAAMIEDGVFSMNTSPEHSRCIASDCMAWCWRRWERTEHGHAFEAYQHEPGAVPVDGFCGLARQA